MKNLNLKFVAFLATILITSTLNVRDSFAQKFTDGDIDFNMGLGIFRTFAIGSEYNIGIPPISISADYCFMEDIGIGNIGLGGFIGFSTAKEEHSFTYANQVLYEYGWKNTALIIGAKGTYHFNINLPDNIDLYGSVILYYMFVSDKYYEDGDYSGSSNNVNPFGSRPGGSLVAGVKYYFIDDLAAFVEVGYSISIFTFGVTLKI